MNELSEFNLSEHQLNQFDIYYNLLVKYNKLYNLTAIVEKSEVYIKHFYDSMKVGEFVDLKNKSLIDVGSGAGFPSIPLKILYPNLSVTIIDSLKKRTNFLEMLTTELGIEVEIIHGRAEEYVKTVTSKFDFATARAVAKTNVLLELCIPYLKIGGSFLCMKSLEVDRELELAKNALKKLDSEIKKIGKYKLPSELGGRTLVVIEKNKETSSKYPRQFSTIKKTPL